jgi:Reverse transcriptase (RNA-dependent DNA polymerase)/Zinc knuckle
MHGHVFQVFSESNSEKQYAKTIEVLSQYVAKTMKHANDLAPLLKKLDVPTISTPKPLDSTATDVDKEIWKEEIKVHVARKNILEMNLMALHSVIWGQCSPNMQAKVKSMTGFEKAHESGDCVWLLKSIKGVTFSISSERYTYAALYDAELKYLLCKQKDNESTFDYLERFRTTCEVFEHYGGIIGGGKAANDAVESDASIVLSAAERQKKAADNTMAYVFLRNADPARYQSLVVDLENQYTRGNNQFPSDLPTAYTLLSKYRTVERSHEKKSGHHQAPTVPTQKAEEAEQAQSTESGLTFAQPSDKVPAPDGTLNPEIRCYKCNKNGHYANQCPSTTNVQLLHFNDKESAPVFNNTLVPHFTFYQDNIPGAMIPDHWVLLDSQSTVSVFKNKSFLSNIRPSDTKMTVYTNGGTQVSSLIGDVNNFGTVWYNPDSLANILSLAEVRKVCRVTMDTDDEPAMFVHRNNGMVMKFVEYKSGLYYHDTSQQEHNFTFVSTVTDNKRRFTDREIADADAAIALHRKLGRPSQKQFELMLKEGHIRNCPVTVDDAKRAFLLYGPCVANLKGTAVKHSLSHVESVKFISLPDYILEHHKDITLCVDIFYVQKLMFLTTISRKVRFRTVTPIADRSKKTILKELGDIIRIYSVRGFTVTNIHGDNEFECVRYDILPCALNIVTADDHVGEIERSIRTIKERVRTLIHGLPFRRLPRLMVREMVFAAVKLLNQFPVSGGISDTMSPYTIMTGRPSIDFNALKLEFGLYVQVFENNNPTNTMKERNTGAIVLSHTGNVQGDYFFMSLETGRRISRHAWTLIPMPQMVIDRVEQMALLEQQPVVEGGLPLFEWAPNVPIIEDNQDDVEIMINGHDDVVFENVIPQDNEGVVFDHDENNGLFDELVDIPVIVDNPHPLDAEDPEEEEPEIEVEPDFVAPAIMPDVNPHHDVDGVDRGFHDEEEGNESDDDESVNDQSEEKEQKYNLRGNRERSYNYRYDHQFLVQASESLNESPIDMHRYINGFLFTQMSARAGIKKHGQKAIDALLVEFGQLREKEVLKPVDVTTLTDEQKASALPAVNLIKEKRDGKIKGRTCADGSSQRALYPREETASPTMSNEALFLSLMIDAKEHRDVGIADVQGAYLNAIMKDFVLMRITGRAVEIFCTVNPEYRSYVFYENGVPVLIVQLVKALYGCVQSALLWYNLFVSTLLDIGFVLNPYDPCVANCEIHGKQCTIAWYVDDMKISHVDESVVTDIMQKIEAKFGKMTIARGKNHNFLGMDITFCDDETLTINMRNYIKETIDEAGIIFHASGVATPAKHDLFVIDETSEKLSLARSDLFHRLVAKLLYLSKRSRPDIQLAVAFLTTRVSCSTEEDWLKLHRVLLYLKGTLDLHLILGADSLLKMETWVDAAYAVHGDMRSHTGGVVSFGRGSVISKSIKQKLNTKSSTEAEVVGASDFFPTMIWARMFLEAQGYQLVHNILHQDNKSAILLERNGKGSSSQKTRHIDIRFFFLKDRLTTEQLQIHHCPTLHMLADFLTKPLQGLLFRKFRAVLLGHEHISILGDNVDAINPPAPCDLIEERVDINIMTAANEAEILNHVLAESREWYTVERKKTGPKR